MGFNHTLSETEKQKRIQRLMITELDQFLNERITEVLENPMQTTANVRAFPPLVQPTIMRGSSRSQFEDDDAYSSIHSFDEYADEDTRVAEPVTQGTGFKNPNPWIQHVKSVAQKQGISYRDALKHPHTKQTYRK